jgi:hypothetical protein
MPFGDGASPQYAIFHNLFDIVVLYNSISICFLSMEIM